MRPDEQAQESELAEWIKTQRAAILPKPTQPSATYCQDAHCGCRIPARRRKAIPGVQYCAECQARIERENTKRGIR